MFFAENIKLLRKRRKRTQDEVSSTVQIPRPTLSGYENGVAVPPFPTLLSLSNFYGVSIDTLIRVNLGTLREHQLCQLERGFDVYLKGSNLRVLATTVDNNNNENIELVNERASAGYTSGFADPEYIRVLPTFHLPFLSKQKKYRTFQISGDSMLPIPDGAWVTGEYIQNWLDIKDRNAYVIVTLNDGIVFKVAENNISSDEILTLHSLNPLYTPYNLKVTEIQEVWKFVNYINPELPNRKNEHNSIIEHLSKLDKEIGEIKTKIGKDEAQHKQ